MKTCLLCLVFVMACGASPTESAKPVPNGVDQNRPLPFVPKPAAQATLVSVDESRICGSTDECTLVEKSCGNTLAVNKFELDNMLGALGSCGWEEHVEQERTPQCYAGMCRASSNIKACANESECVVVTGSCNDIEVVNTTSAETVKNAMATSRANQKCPESAFAPLAVGCLGGQCVGVEKEQAGLRRGCGTPEDCVIVSGLCSQPFAVHKKHEERTTAYFEKKNAATSCPSGSAPQTRARCDNGYCVAALASP